MIHDKYSGGSCSIYRGHQSGCYPILPAVLLVPFIYNTFANRHLRYAPSGYEIG